MNISNVKVIILIFTTMFLAILPSCSKDESSSESEGNDTMVNSTPAVRQTAPRQTSADIKFKMEPGESHTFTIREEVDLTEQNKSRITKNKIKYWVEIEFVIKCTEIDPTDGAYIVTQEWTRGKGGDGFKEWDTDKHLRAPDYVKRWRRLIGRGIQLAIMSNGEIVELWDGETLADAILYEKGINKKDYDEKSMYMYERQLEAMLDRVWESKEGMIPPLARGYPTEALKLGDVWTTREMVSSTREGYGTTEMELVKIKDGTAYFDAKVAISAGDDPTDGNALARVDDNLLAIGYGEIQVDLNTGLCKYAKIKSTVNYDANIDDRLWQQEKNKSYKGTSISSIKMVN